MLPLVQSRGRLTVSGACVRFKPFYCPNGGRQAGESIPLCSIIRIAKRLHLFQDVGIEIFLEDSPSALFVCENQNHRDIIYKILLDQPGAFALLVNQPELNTMENLSLDAITERWRMGGISTFDYLMYLNFFCGRTFNDVAQYPVFPWVLQDYTSEQLDLSDPSVFRDLAKPVGALNTARLKQFMTRYAEMPPKERFMYGTHYSSPSYVTFYLLREAPEYALRLQDGKFDAPDRLFHSIAESWQSALDNPTDVKELIPEFFDPSNEGKFLRNLQGLHFGDKQCGETVGDVILPPWAKDAADFVRIQREALESPFVSKNIHQWIDLIFGYKQNGSQAERAHNVFYPLTYEECGKKALNRGSVDRRVLERQIREFGQTPKQLFALPHPRRAVEASVSHNTVLTHCSQQTVTDKSHIPSWVPQRIDDESNLLIEI